MKKIISILMLLSLLLTAGSISAFATEEEDNTNYWIAETPDIKPEDLPGTVIGLSGDADKNSVVNVKDATAIQKHVAEIIVLDETALTLSDADLSLTVNIKDATAIQKYVAGIETDFLIGNAIYEPYALDERLYGEWTATVDTADITNEILAMMFEDDPLAVKYIHLETFPVKQNYTFRDDYTYTITVDETVLNSSVKIVKADLTKDFSAYFVALAKDMGYNMTANEFAQAMGYSSVSAFVDEMFPAELWEEMLIPTDGHYRTTPDGKIYLDEFTDTYYEFYTVEGNTLKITGNNENEFPEQYPITFTKVK